jgi:hypothetical protein
MTDRHEHLDEGTIHAWLDGGLPPDESARVAAQTAGCAECAALVAEARGFIAASSRILSSLDSVPAGVIPGSDATVDQLSALRARRRRDARHWWSDRRMVAAASLLFVAGASGLVWRYSSGDVLAPVREAVVDAVQPMSDSAFSRATAATPASAREAPARDAKLEASTRASNPAPARVASARAEDTTMAQKAAVASAPLERRVDKAANEAKRADSSVVAVDRMAADSTRVSPRQAFESQLRQQGAAQQNQQGLRQRAESPPAAPPTVLGGTGARLGPVITTGVGSAADAAGSTTSCYQLRSAAPGQASTVIADSVRLLNETPPWFSDPTWYLARAAGWTADTALLWRRVDSTTVELRSRIASRPLAVRFSTTTPPLPLPVADPGVRAALARRIACN